MISNSGIGAPLQELLDDGLLVQGGGDVQRRVAILKLNNDLAKSGNLRIIVVHVCVYHPLTAFWRLR